MMVKVGQVYASNRKADIATSTRQQRTVRQVDGCFVWLANWWDPGLGRRIRIRDDITSQSIPGHRLVRDVS